MLSGLLLSFRCLTGNEGVVGEESRDGGGDRPRRVWHSASHGARVVRSSRMAQLLLSRRVVVFHVVAVDFLHYNSVNPLESRGNYSATSNDM